MECLRKVPTLIEEQFVNSLMEKWKDVKIILSHGLH
jgi:hypothetical protein